MANTERLPTVSNPHSVALRAAGLRVTSARVAVLRLAPDVLREHGHLSPLLLHEAARRDGVAVSRTALANVLYHLITSGLLPATSLLRNPPQASTTTNTRHGNSRDSTADAAPQLARPYPEA